MNDAPSRAEALFLAAAEIAEPEERAALLVRECGGDRALRERVEGLLASHEGAGDFLEASAPSSEMEFSRVKLEEAGDRIGPYHLREQIGEGGFGTVWVAEQERPVRRRVALKIIKLGMDTKEVIARFEQERQALAMMDHPNIAKVFDAGATGTGRPYFVMELVRGVKITEYCDQTKLSTRGRLELFIAVCQAVQHAHQKGVIHRDLKPSNILVTLHDGVPVPKVIDFGVAKATRQQRLTDLTVYTQFEQMVGTPLYMSPEQAEISGVDIDTRSDIYSLGVLLYELLTGRTPFDPEELMRRGLDEIRRTIREQEPQTPSMFVRTMALDRRTDVARHRHADGAKLIGQIRGDLDWIVMKALEKDRSRRYDTANGLAADLKRHLNNEPVVARPASAAYRFQKAFRRNKVVFTAATAVAVALVAGIGMSTWQTVESRKAQRATEVARNGEQQQRLEAQSAQKVADAEARNASESQRQWRRLLYASDISLAQQTLKLNNLGRARRLLERHRPAPGEEDLRGWEWRYLWQLTRSNAFVTLTNRPMRGWSVSFSPDGNRLAVGWNDGRVDLWDVPGQRYIRALSDRKPRWARVAFSPVRNLLASTSEPKVVALYDLDSNQESILWRADDDAWQVRELSFSPDGSRLVIYAGAKPELGDAVWVVNVSSSQIESRHATVCSQNGFFGAARLSPDNRRLYLTRSDPVNSRCRIQCIDLTTGQELWQTEPQRDQGLSALAMSPDGMVLASGTAFEDPAIRVWDAATGRLLRQLDGHTSWVGKLVFTQDGRRLISAAADQSIRFWDTNNWTETHVLRGHVDEVHAVAISERAQLIASVSKDGDLMLWKDDGKTATDGYTRLPENLGRNEVVPLDQSRLLLLPSDKPPQLVDLKRDSAPVSVPEIGASTNVLGCFGTNILCHWDGTNQILVRELRGAEFIQRGAIALASAIRPTGFAYDVTHQLLAWSEATSSTSIYLARLATPGRRTELRSDVPALVPFRFSGDGNHLAAWTTGGDSLRVWNVESGHIVASINERLSDATFAAGGRVLVVAIKQGDDHEIRFYDLAHRESAPRGIAGRLLAPALAVSRDGGLVAASTFGGQVRLFDPARGEWIDDLHGHMNAALGIAFSADGGRLFSAYGAREAVKLWDVRTRQELLTLSGTGTTLRTARWSADGDVILAGAPWQAWRAPSWEEIAAEEAKEKTQPQRP